MKNVAEMDNEELADLLEMVTSYDHRRFTKIEVSMHLSVATLRGGEPLRENALFERAPAWELLKGPSFMFALYDELIRRLQPARIELTGDHIDALGILALQRNSASSRRPKVRSPIEAMRRIVDDLYDLRLVEFSGSAADRKCAINEAGLACFEDYASKVMKREVSLPPR